MDDVLEPVTQGLFQLALTFWWVWLALGLSVALNLILAAQRRRRLARSGIGDVDRMNGREFETYLAMLFRRYGYSVEHTGKSGDYGADLVICKDQQRTVIQAKRYSKNVGIKAVQEVVAAKKVYSCQGAIVVTNSGYTQAARNLARANDVVLWDRERLVKVMLSAQSGQSPPQASSTFGPGKEM
jgi:restriction system protein